MRLRVMSFNVRTRTILDLAHPWRRRREQVAQQVRAFDPDILGTQELDRHQADDLRERLAGYAFFGAGRRDGADRGEMCGVFVRADRFERTGGGHFWLSDTPDVPGSKLPRTFLPRVVTWIKLTPRERPDAEFAFFNTHFPVFDRRVRAEAARTLITQIAALAHPLPCVATGDFNDVPGSLAHRVMTGNEVVPLIDTIHADGERTIHFYRGGTRGRRIDWILASPALRCVESSVDRTRGPRGYASDHYPVTAVLELD